VPCALLLLLSDGGGATDRGLGHARVHVLGSLGALLELVGRERGADACADGHGLRERRHLGRVAPDNEATKVARMPKRWACAVRSAARRARNVSINTGGGTPKGDNPLEGRASQGAHTGPTGPQGDPHRTHTDKRVQVNGRPLKVQIEYWRSSRGQGNFLYKPASLWKRAYSTCC